MSQKIFKKARAMIKEADMPQKVLGKTIGQAAYLYDRTSARALNMKSLFESFFCKVLH